MDGFSVTPSAVGAAARSAMAVSAGIEGVEVAAALERLGAVLPGSATAAAAGALAARWEGSTRALAGDMTAHAGGLADTAASYDGTDTSVAVRVQAAG